jgi:hypothetical protein
MPLIVPPAGCQRLERNTTATTSAEYGTSVTCGASANTKHTSYTELIASTAYDSYGIAVRFTNVATATTITDALVDIAIGAASSETVIIPNLLAGQVGATATAAMGGGVMYYFPIKIPAGVRLSANGQAAVAGDTVHTSVYLFQRLIPGAWYGSRVTAYGINSSGASRGTNLSPGSNTYVDATLTASTTNPIRYLQLGYGNQGDTGWSSLRGMFRITAGGQVIADALPFAESTTVEEVNLVTANFLLSHMRFNLPAAISLSVGAMRSSTAEARSVAAWGVD